MRDNNPIKLKVDKKIKSKITNNFNSVVEYVDIELKYGNVPVFHYTNQKLGKLTITGICDFEVTSIEKDEFIKDFYISCVEGGGYIGLIHRSYPFRYLYAGEGDRTKIKKVIFEIPELSTYFVNEIHYDMKSENHISGKFEIEELKTKIAYLNNIYEFKVYQEFSLSPNEVNTGFSFLSKILISFDSDNYLTFKDIENLMYKSIHLFTFITGYPLTVNTITLRDDLNKTGYLYIPQVKRNKEYDVNVPKCFMRSYIFRKNFLKICESFFTKKSELFENIWGKTVPLFEFSGVLEYETMLFTSVLDRYFTNYYESNYPKGLIELDYDVTLANIKFFLNNNSDFQDIINNSSFKNKIKINAIKNILPKPSDQKSFIQKKEFYFNAEGNKILDIVFDEDEFNDLKEVRNKAAHGDIQILPSDNVNILNWKVKFLTFHLIYRELGISDEDFLKACASTHHPVFLNSKINRKKFDLYTGRAKLFELDCEDFEFIESRSAIIYVFLNKGGRLLLIKELSQELSNNFYGANIMNLINSKEKYPIKSYIEKYILNKKLELFISYVGKAYVEYDIKSLECNDIYVLSDLV